MLRTRVFPRHSMLRLRVEEGVSDAETVMAAKLQQALPIFIQAPCAKLTHTGGPGVVIGTHSSVEITKDEQWFLFRDSVDGCAEVVVELVLCFCQGGQGWCVSTN